MKIRELMAHWESNGSGAFTKDSYDVRLPVEAAAKVAALADMYPTKTMEGIVADLLTAALEDFETSLPYVRGDKVVGIDEMGDPLYEDVGPTPRFLELARKHIRRYRQQVTN